MNDDLITTTCKYCGKEIVRTKSMTKRIKDLNPCYEFCSQECYFKYQEHKRNALKHAVDLKKVVDVNFKPCSCLDSETRNGDTTQYLVCTRAEMDGMKCVECGVCSECSLPKSCPIMKMYENQKIKKLPIDYRYCRYYILVKDSFGVYYTCLMRSGIKNYGDYKRMYKPNYDDYMSKYEPKLCERCSEYDDCRICSRLCPAVTRGNDKTHHCRKYNRDVVLGITRCYKYDDKS